MCVPLSGTTPPQRPRPAARLGCAPSAGRVGERKAPARSATIPATVAYAAWPVKVLFLSPASFGSFRRSKQFLALAMGRQGHEVGYVEPPVSPLSVIRQPQRWRDLIGPSLRSPAPGVRDVATARRARPEQRRRTARQRRTVAPGHQPPHARPGYHDRVLARVARRVRSARRGARLLCHRQPRRCARGPRRFGAQLGDAN